MLKYRLYGFHMILLCIYIEKFKIIMAKETVQYGKKEKYFYGCN
ncbi:Hypothetical protein CCH01_000510 [Clostridium chauvoei JF4335]|nr:Hypothetical protein CCH01_000510 [Clostridium chauvoei JF4335]